MSRLRELFGEQPPWLWLVLLAALAALGYMGYSIASLSRLSSPGAPQTPTYTATTSTDCAGQSTTTAASGSVIVPPAGCPATPTGPAQTTVPLVNGQPLSVAESQLQANGYTYTVVTAHDAAAKGTVISTDPAGGTIVNAGSKITLSVSAGPIEVTVPPTRGLKLLAAVKRLHRLGFAVHQHRVPSTLFRRGRVVGETPGAGRQAVKGSVVTVYVSRGKPIAPSGPVPHLRGRSQSDAVAVLANAGFIARFRFVHNPLSVGTIVSTLPRWGAQAPLGSAVTVTVSDGPRPKPKPATKVAPPTTTTTAGTPAPPPATTTTSSQPKKTSGSHTTTTTTTAAPAPPVARNGKIAFVSRRDGNDEIYLSAADGSHQLNISDDPSSDTAPAFSPDGRQLLFTSNRSGNRDVYLMSASGGTPGDLTHNPADDFAAVFSPDGGKIAFVSNRKGSYGIYTMNADGSGVRLVVSDGADDYSPVFSPDGKTIVFTSNKAGSYDLYSVPASGGTTTHLTSLAGDEADPAFSADGKTIIFSASIDGNYNIYKIPSGGGGAHRLIGGSSSGDNLGACFSPDGKQIVFSSTRNGTSAIYLANADGSDVHQISSGQGGDTSPAWQPLPAR